MTGLSEPGWTAAQYVEAARKAAHDFFLYEAPRDLRCCRFVNVNADGFVFTEHGQYPKRDIFSAPFTAENTASESALVRALVSSAVTVEDIQEDPYHPPVFTATLGDSATFYGATADAATNALLALLVPSEPEAGHAEA